MPTRWQKYFAELIGTFALVFVGPISVTIYATVLGISQPYYFGAGLLAIGAAFGVVVAAMVYTFGHISGTHINPAVTVGLLAIRKIGLTDAVGYIIFQLVGAAIAGGLQRLILPQGIADYFGLTLPGAAIGYNPWMAVLVEVVLTFFLMLTIMGAAVDNRAPSGFAGIIIGSVVAMDIWIGGPLTGSSLNPARTFGPALVSGNWGTFWVYVVGPIVGALIAAIIYNYLFLEKK